MSAITEAAQLSANATGEPLSDTAALTEAERGLRRALAIDPLDAATVMALARVLLALGKVPQAYDAIESLAHAGATLPNDLQLLRAQLLLAMSRFPEAISEFRNLIDAGNTNGRAQFGLAVALGECGLNDDAAGAARSAIANGSDNAGSHFVLARALFAMDRFDEAQAEFLELVRRQPLHAATHSNLADLVWMRTGDIDAATAELDAALLREPFADPLRIVRSRLLECAGQPGRAYAELARALTFDPRNMELHLAAAQISIRFDAQRALAHAERAIHLSSGHGPALHAYADALLAVGDTGRLLAVTEALLGFDADDGHAFALRASALRMRGDARYRALYDYERVVRACLLDVPDGWADLEHYLADLAQSLHRRHDPLRAHPVAQTLRGGTQLQLHPQTSDDPAIRALPQAIAGPIRRYIEAIGPGTDVLRKRNTGAGHVRDFWSVRLRPGGFHLNHFHGRGWLSSACYIEIPQAACDNGGAGWLRFGEPCMPTSPSLAPEYFVRPEPGLLVLFPSWMWHGTIPFAGAAGETRLTVAFDVLPAVLPEM